MLAKILPKIFLRNKCIQPQSIAKPVSLKDSSPIYAHKLKVVFGKINHLKKN